MWLLPLLACASGASSTAPTLVGLWTCAVEATTRTHREWDTAAPEAGESSLSLELEVALPALRLSHPDGFCEELLVAEGDPLSSIHLAAQRCNSGFYAGYLREAELRLESRDATWTAELELGLSNGGSSYREEQHQGHCTR